MNLTEGERQELESLQRKCTAAIAQVRRARLILMLDDGGFCRNKNVRSSEAPH